MATERAGEREFEGESA